MLRATAAWLPPWKSKACLLVQNDTFVARGLTHE
jgi:hypothetical protein